MAKLFDGKKLFASAIKPTGGQPLDDRAVVQSLSDLTNSSTFVVNGSLTAYKGMLVAVVEDKQVYMLVDETNITSEDSWVAVGSGNGSLAVETYGEAIALASEDNIGQVIYVTTKSSYDPDGEEGEKPAVEYEAAPYIVIGTGKLMKLAASETNTGNVVSDVAELQTKVSGLETAVGVEAKDDKPATGLYEKIADAQSAAEDYAEGLLVNEDGSAKFDAAGSANAALSAATEYADGLVKDEEGKSRFDAAGSADAAKSAVIGESTDASGATTIYGAKKYAEDLNSAMNTRVEKLEEIDHSHDNMTVLNGITAEKVSNWDKAQENVIEKLVFNGEEVTVDAQTKTATFNTPADYITGLAKNESVLSVDGGKLSSTLSLNYYKGEGEDAGKYEIQLVGRNNTVVGRVDAKDFVKDGMLESVELKENPANKEEGTYLVFTWNTDAGVSEPMYVPVTSLLDVYKAGNGLDLDGKTFSVSLKANESYLEVTESGLATKGIDTAITNAKNDVIGTAEDTKDMLTLRGVKLYAEGVASDALSAATEYADGLVKDEEGKSRFDAAGSAAAVLSAATEYADGLVKDEEGKSRFDAAGSAAAALSAATDYADKTFVKTEGFNEFAEEMETKLEGIEANAEVNVIESIKVNGVDATIAEGKVASVKVDAKDIELGVNITGKEGATIYSGDTKISTVLQGIQDSIRAAVAGGVNSVTSADAVIEVNNADPNNPKVSLKVESASENTVAAGHIEMVKGENGIYGMMYYDGDDFE